MRKIALTLAVAAAAVAVPAQANEARVEARGGVAWTKGDTQAIAGVAAGYDWDLGQSAFVGVEGSADKVLVDGANVALGTSVRAGVKTGDKGKLYAIGGYSFNVGDLWQLGAGYEYKVSQNVYVKGQYLHYFDNGPDANAVIAGVGMNF